LFVTVFACQLTVRETYGRNLKPFKSGCQAYFFRASWSESLRLRHICCSIFMLSSIHAVLLACARNHARKRFSRDLFLRIVAAAALFLTAIRGWPALMADQDSLPLQAAARENVRTGYAGDSACKDCHRGQFDGYQATAHHRTSRQPNGVTIPGHFSGRERIMTTFNPELTFQMDARDGHFYESSILNRRGHLQKHTEQIDIVIGSATKGQTYLYWRGNRLFELPVSYWTELNQWVNSPGYVDGSADFERPVTPRCIECHATYIESLGPGPTDNLYKKNSLILGISCERCHGPGLSHVETRAGKSANPVTTNPMPPIALSRDREIDVCGQCHSGVGQSLVPPFSFRPGEQLSQTIAFSQPASTKQIDVHGNQVVLLERSRCFLSSPTMSCSTCHGVHSVERPAASYSAKCLQCHRQEQCGMFPSMGTTIATNCIDCHMPIQESRLLTLDAEDSRLKARVRNHSIAIYPLRSIPKN
jgi:hypothetical protein